MLVVYLHMRARIDHFESQHRTKVPDHNILHPVRSLRHRAHVCQQILPQELAIREEHECVMGSYVTDARITRGTFQRNPF